MILLIVCNAIMFMSDDILVLGHNGYVFPPLPHPRHICHSGVLAGAPLCQNGRGLAAGIVSYTAGTVSKMSAALVL